MLKIVPGYAYNCTGQREHVGADTIAVGISTVLPRYNCSTIADSNTPVTPGICLPTGTKRCVVQCMKETLQFVLKKVRKK